MNLQPTQWEKKSHSEAITNYVTNPLGQAISKPLSLFNTLLTKTSTTEADTAVESEYTTYEEIFAVSEKYFSGVIIFSFLKGEFTPIRWSPNLKGSPTPVKTDKPSLFRMTVQSRSPYHGFIIPNEQHKSFFNGWGFSETPKHVTCIPLFNNVKHIVGAYMGIADETLDQKCLYLATKWSKSVSFILEEDKKSKLNRDANFLHIFSHFYKKLIKAQGGI